MQQRHRPIHLDIFSVIHQTDLLFPQTSFSLPFLFFAFGRPNVASGGKKFLYGDPLQDLNGEIVNGSNTCCCPRTI